MFEGKIGKQFKFTFQDLNIKDVSFERILEYEGGNSQEMNLALINGVILAARTKVTVHCGYVMYDKPAFDKAPYHININGMPFYLGTNLFQQFRRSSHVAVFLCTTGQELNDWSSELMDEGEFMKSHIVDVMGVVAMERALEKAEDTMKASFGRQAMNLTNRISPGLCQWKETDARKLFALLPSEFCNMRINGSIPHHSGKFITGIVGIGKDVKHDPGKCDHCTAPVCVLRRRI